MRAATQGERPLPFLRLPCGNFDPKSTFVKFFVGSSSAPAVVAEIAAKQALVAANRELIAHFEQKIQTTLAHVWGEEEPAP